MGATLATGALTTLDALKGELGISGSTEDSYLRDLIDRASAAFVRHLGRDAIHYEEEIAETVDGHGTATLAVSRTPLLGIDSIALSLEPGTYTVPTADYTIEDAGAGLIRKVGGGWSYTGRVVLPGFDPIGSSELALYTVTYDGGWVTPQQVIVDGTLTRTLPYDIEEAVLAMATQKYRQKGRDPQVKSVKTLSASVTYDTTVGGGLPDVAEMAIAAHRRVGVA